PFENPVRRWVRLREKARQFAELPPPRRVPIPKPARPKLLQAVEGVPRVSPEALQRRLDFLLSDAAVKQQLAAPLRPGLSPYFVEFQCWSRQLREIRRVYRAQYLQKLAEVTEIERAREAELYQKERQQRQERKQAHLQRIGEDMKRKAILRDRKRIESKVNEAIEMARRSKLKRQRLFWFRRMETLSKLVVSSDNLEEAFATFPDGSQAAGTSASTTASPSGVLLSRNVSIPYLLRQFGGSKTDPQQKNRRIPGIDNVKREILQMSYDILGEDEERYEAEVPQEADWRDRAKQLYSDSIFDHKQKMALLDSKIAMLKGLQELEKQKGDEQVITAKLIDELEAVKLAEEEAAQDDELRVKAKEARGKDPPGLPPYDAASRMGDT
ncbi:CAMK4, partial [Symbiodinium pilosum]